MAESSACLMRSFSQPSPTSQDSQQGDPLRRALTTSVSFGRFMSESLAWEKWSSFTENRYLEEVEKYSRPGSVAEKKAYFEAHYQRKAAKKAAASLEQQNAAVEDIPASNLTHAIGCNSQIEIAQAQEGCLAAIEERQGEGDPTSDLILYVDGCGLSRLDGNKIESDHIEGTEQGIEQPTFLEKLAESSILPECGQSPHEGCRMESDQIEGTEQGVEQPTFVEKQVEPSILPEYGQSPFEGCTIENEQIDRTKLAIERTIFVEKQVESSILLEDAQDISDEEAKEPVEDAATLRVSAFSDKKKPTSSSAKLSGHRQESRLRPPVKPTMPTQPKKGDEATSYSKRTGRESVEKKRSAPKSLHMSINFGSRVGDINKTSPPVLQKIVNSRFVRNLSRTSTESTKQQTPIRASTNGVSKHLSAASQPVTGRTKELPNHLISESMARDRRSGSLYMRSSISSTTSRTKAQYPIASSSLYLRTEERAAKRKEKLQQKLSIEEAEKEQLQARLLKGKIRNDAKDVRQSIASHGKANASFHQGMKPLDVQTKKMKTTQPCSPGTERKQEADVLCNNSRPPWRHSVKGDSLKDLLAKNHRPPTHSTKLFPKKNNMRENTSPNIQVQRLFSAEK